MFLALVSVIDVDWKFEGELSFVRFSSDRLELPHVGLLLCRGRIQKAPELGRNP